MRKTVIAAALATIVALPVQASPQAPVRNQGEGAVANVQASCRTMMNGWERSNAIDQGATITATVRNNSKNRMVVLAKRKDGQFWQVTDLEPGASRQVRVNEGTNFAWARHGGLHHCVKGFSLSNNGSSTFS